MEIFVSRPKLVTKKEHFEECNNEEQLNQAYKNLTNTILEVSKKICKKRFNKHEKPYWNSQLTTLSKHEKNVWHTWVDAGRPRCGPLYQTYKDTKKLFKKARISAEIEYEKAQMDSISKSHDIDQKYFWHLVNKTRKQHLSTQPIVVNRKVISDSKEIRDTWKDYFNNLYTPSQKDHYN